MKKRLLREERGFTLIEVVLAIALLGIVAVAFLGGLGAGSRAISVADERATAESLARTQMEFVRSQEYIDYSQDPHDPYEVIKPVDIDPSFAEYVIDFKVVPFDPETGLPYGETGGVFVQDDGIQKMTVTILHHGEFIFELEGYRTYR